MLDLKFIKTGGKIFNTIGFGNIEKQIKEYRSFFQLRNDFEWLVHNCNVMYGDENKITESAKSLMQSVDEEINSITTCYQCYEMAFTNPNQSFVMPCTPLHPLIWSKPSNMNIYWPAKCMYLKEGVAHVRYFGDHCTEDVPVAHCYLFSKKTPIVQPLRTQMYLNAMEVSSIACMFLLHFS